MVAIISMYLQWPRVLVNTMVTFSLLTYMSLVIYVAVFFFFLYKPTSLYCAQFGASPLGRSGKLVPRKFGNRPTIGQPDGRITLEWRRNQIRVSSRYTPLTLKLGVGV